MRVLLTTFWNDDSAQDLVEYSLLLAFIALAAIAILKSAGTSDTKMWTLINTSLKSATKAAKKAAS